MKGIDNRQLIAIYLSLATGCILIGIGLVIVTLLVCNHFGIDITRSFWILAIPVFGTLILNVLLIEIVQRIRKK
jgi:hypothetical protein